MDLHADTWKCLFCEKPFAGRNHTRVSPLRFLPRRDYAGYGSPQQTSQRHAICLDCSGPGAALGQLSGIMWCRQVTPAVNAEMGQILKDMQGRKITTAKRSSDAAATATGLASAAAAVAALNRNRARSSLSSGPDVGPRPALSGAGLDRT